MRWPKARATACALAALGLLSPELCTFAQAQKAKSPGSCLTYGKVEITGTLRELRGVFILKPLRPLCARARPDAETDDLAAEPIDKALEVHLFATDTQKQARLRASLNKKVAVTGTLGSAHTRYHRAPLILSVDRVKQE